MFQIIIILTPLTTEFDIPFDLAISGIGPKLGFIGAINCKIDFNLLNILQKIDRNIKLS